MNPTELTPAELRDELDRIDRMLGARTSATMMRRNELQNELRSRPEACRACIGLGWAPLFVYPGKRNVNAQRCTKCEGRGYVEPTEPRPLIDPTTVAAARTQLAALRGVGQ